MTDSSLTPKTISNLQEVITRGAKTLVITNQDLGDKVFDNLIKIPETSPLISEIENVRIIHKRSSYHGFKKRRV